MSTDSSPASFRHRLSPEPNVSTPFDDCNLQNGGIPFVGNEPTVTSRRSNRLARACTVRSAARLYGDAQPVIEPKPKVQQEWEEESPPQQRQCSKIVTPLVGLPESSQLQRWSLRSMWELASVLNFLHVFRPLLNILVEFSAEEFETALISPNDTLSDIHIPLLKAIPPITRMALTRETWVTVLCRKLRDWWYWVADGELPIVASHGLEVEVYKKLDPGIRVVILKALCDIRIEQEDIRNYIDKSVKRGVHLSAFRKERVGGDSHGISYWYEDDPIIGHRLYREIRKVEANKVRTRGSRILPTTSYEWETVATNFDEFQDVSDKLYTSKSRTEASLGKKLKIDMLPEIEKVHKRKEKLLKKQHRQALLLDHCMSVDGIAPGRSLRDRKPVTYTFDDYDRSISEAIKTTKNGVHSPDLLLNGTKQPTLESVQRIKEVKPETSINGQWNDPLHASQHVNFSATSPRSSDYDDLDEDNKPETLDRRFIKYLFSCHFLFSPQKGFNNVVLKYIHMMVYSNRQRKKPQRYSEREFVEAVSDDDADFDSDDDIVGEAVYDEEYLRKRKQKKLSISSEGDDEYDWDEKSAEDEDDEAEDSLSISDDSDDSDEPKQSKKFSNRTRRETKLRSVELRAGLRRSNRATKNRVNYGRYQLSESEMESELMKSGKSKALDEHDYPDNKQYPVGSQDSGSNTNDQERKVDQPVETYPETAQKPNIPCEDEVEVERKRSFLDLNELAPSSGFDDVSNMVTKDDKTDDL